MNAEPQSFVLPSYKRSSVYLFVGGLTLFVGLNLTAYLLDFQGDFVFVTGFPIVLLGSIASYFLKRRHFRQYGYAWYSKTFPASVRGGGRVSCRHCGSNHVAVRNLMQRTFHRAHICGQCGETLYYSPER
ncbi:hypothetical protein AB4Z46_08625 [Variovorax sp. M-6]|uniref:hypothetical protein n=1 Tax=Variovorax sp. M-6 TaxID=3233041 RepID=UPI003F953948